MANLRRANLSLLGIHCEDWSRVMPRSSKVEMSEPPTVNAVSFASLVTLASLCLLLQQLAATALRTQSNLNDLPPAS